MLRRQKLTPSEESVMSEEDHEIHLAMGPLRNNFTNSKTPTDWLNELFNHIWPHLSRYLASYVVTQLEPLIKSSMPFSMQGFKFTRLDFGNNPLTIRKVIYLDESDRESREATALVPKESYDVPSGEIKLLAQVDVDARTNIEMKIPNIGSFGISKVSVLGNASILLGPLIDEVPFFAAISATFLTTPHLQIEFSGFGAKLTKIPQIKNLILKNIISQMKLHIVSPNAITLKMLSQNDANEDANRHILRKLHLEPKGICRISVLQAQGLPNVDSHHKHFKKFNKSDPYVIISCGAHEFRTNYIKDNLNPVWEDQTFDIIFKHQSMEILAEVYDRDVKGDGKKDELMGSAVITVKDLLTKGQVWLPLDDHGRKGKLQIAGEFLKATKSQTEDSTGTKKAILTVMIESAKGLPSGISPFATASFPPAALNTKSTFQVSNLTNIEADLPQADVQNPIWEQAFSFLIFEPFPNLLHFTVSTTERMIGKCSLEFNKILSNKDLEFEGYLPLEGCNGELRVIADVQYLVDCAISSQDESESEEDNNEENAKKIDLFAKESQDWLNDILSALWFRISKYAAEQIKLNVEPMMRTMVPSMIGGIHFVNLDFGTKPLKIQNSAVSKDGLTLEILLDISFCSNSKVVLGIDEQEKVLCGVNDISLQGRVSVICNPLLHKPPFFSALQLSFLDTPGLEMTFSSLASIADWKFVKPLVRDMISQQMAAAIITPNRFFLEMEVSDSPFESHNYAAKGILCLKIIEGKNIKKMDVGSQSDPYIVCTLGATTYRTPTINNTANPVWIEGNSFVFVCTSEEQTVNLECWDDDLAIKYDDLVGRFSMRLCEFVDKIRGNGTKLTDMWVMLDDEGGQLHIDVRFLKLKSHPRWTGCYHVPNFEGVRNGLLTIMLDEWRSVSEEMVVAVSGSGVWVEFILTSSVDGKMELKARSFSISPQLPKWKQTIYIPFQDTEIESLVLKARFMDISKKVLYEWKNNILNQDEYEILKGRVGMKSLKVDDCLYAGSEVILGTIVNPVGD